MGKGVKVRLIPRCVLENAKKLGWVGEGGDTYQILVFTNELGQKCHGLSITTREELEAPNMKKIMLMRVQRKAIRVLSNFWLKYRHTLTSKSQVLSTDSNNYIDIPNSPFKNPLRNSLRALKSSGSFFYSFMSNINDGLIDELVPQDIYPEEFQKMEAAIEHNFTSRRRKL